MPKNYFFKILLFLLAFTPLVFHSGTLFPFVFPKVLFIRLILVIFLVGLASFLFFPKKFEEFFQEIKTYFKNPIFISLVLFILLMGLSTIFAPNPSLAFWGNVERGEGLVSWLFYFVFFVGALTFFSKKDWKTFFVLTIFVFLFLFLDQIYFYFAGKSFWSFILTIPPTTKNASLVGNTTFLAAFYLFVIFSALYLIKKGKGFFSQQLPTIGKALFYILLSLVVLCAIFGIFVSHTIGAIFGLILAIFVCLIYLILKKEAPVKLKKIALAGTFSIILFLILFLVTFNSPFWEKVPGFDEITALSWEDTSVQTRLTAYLITKNALNPFKVGIGRFLIGWGPDHFLYTFQKFYEPRYLNYDRAWFDRGHNKILDVLAMEGFLGFLAYLALWFFVFKTILKERDFREGVIFLFFGVSYFAQNLFAFDTVATYIPFFAFLALVVQKGKGPGIFEKEKKITLWLGKIILLFLTLFSIFVFYFTLISFRQMLNFVPALSMGRMDLISKNLNNVLYPYNFAQPEIRTQLLYKVVEIAKKKEKEFPQAVPLIKKLIPPTEISAQKEKWNSKYFAMVATAYDAIGEFGLAEKYWKRALETSDKRQDLLYSLGLNYVRQGKKEKALEIAQRIINLDPEITRDRIYYVVLVALAKEKEAFQETTDIVLGIFEDSKKPHLGGEDLKILRNFFNFYLTLFYKEKNEEMFLKTLEKGKLFEEKYEEAFEPSFPRSVLIKQVINAFKKRGWSAIQLKE